MPTVIFNIELYRTINIIVTITIKVEFLFIVIYL